MKDFIANLENMLEVEPGSLQATTLLTAVPSWDSLAAVGFLALADGTYDKAIDPSAIQECKKVSDLAALVGLS